jgi:hypothetical protein
MELRSSGGRRRAVASAVLLMGACALLGASAPGAAAGTQGAGSRGTGPNLIAGSAYLVAPGNLIAGHYYESFPGTADFGLTIDGALALAATGDQDAALRKIVTFIDHDGKDPSGLTVNDWTGIGTSDASGGAIGKEALLAEVVGSNPRSFGGHNLIAALDASVCTRPSAGGPSSGGTVSCPAAGSYLNATSVFDQALGIMAQFRAGQASAAAAPVAYLESLQDASGSFPSLIPPGGGPDVDSTAMAVMALALAPGARAAADVVAGIAWIASRQEHNGGFPGMGAESINSTGLAIQALTLRAGVDQARISAARAFLASQQNGNGGFNADAGQPGSNLRASTQAVGGAVGTSFGTLRVELSRPAAVTPVTPAPVTTTRPPSPQASGVGQHASHAGRRPARPTASPCALAHPGRTATPPGQPAAHRQDARGPARHPAVAQPQSGHVRGMSGALLALVIAGAVVVAAVVALMLGWLLRRRRSGGRASAEPADPATQDQVGS